jgi:hypothetical protein
MNLLCPNCQKVLTVPEQSAGQTMRCPLCSGTFTVPQLPQTPAPVSPSPGSPPAGEDVFRVTPSPAPPSPRLHEPAAPGAGPEPPQPAPTTQPAVQSGFRITISPQVVPWVAPAALFVVFVLLFFPWYTTAVPTEHPGEMTVEWYRQSGWRGGFLGIFHIILLLIGLPVAIAALAVPLMGVRLPPALEPYWPYRTMILTGIVGAATLVLLIELITGSPLEKRIEALIQKPSEDKTDELARRLTTPERRDYARLTVQSLTTPRLALICQLVALAALALQHWMAQRGNRPSPRIDIVW